VTLPTGIFTFVAVVTLSVTGAIVVLMLRGARSGLAQLDHAEDALPQVMTGRYITFFVLTVMAVLHGDFLVMAGLQVAFMVASLADVVIYMRRRAPYGRHLLAAFASAVAAALCSYVVLTE